MKTTHKTINAKHNPPTGSHRTGFWQIIGISAVTAEMKRFPLKKPVLSSVAVFLHIPMCA
jgi:hypothetical protein